MVKKNKRQRDIKTKLMAAICMLLVSSIMMVSSTYAWFTLSTAPEVTGITTSVGANGNLEMALLPTTGQTADITSASGDSLKAINEKNITWGNLVDLSDSTFYGLDEITLYPAKLNAATADDNGNPLTIAAAMLLTPTYGSDGRVSTLEAKTVTSTFDSTAQSFPTNNLYGVRAVGTASGMTDRQIAYRNAISAANTAMSQAKVAASRSLNTNGSALANIAIKKATGGESATYTQADVTSLEKIVTDLLGNGTDIGVLGQIEEAYKNYIVALAASKAAQSTVDDTKFNSLKAEADKSTLYELESWLSSTAEITLGSLNSDLAEYIDKIKATRANVTQAQTDLAALEGDSLTWSQISTPLYKLANIDAMEINGFTPDQIKANMSDLVSSVTSQGGLTVVIQSEAAGDSNSAVNGGVYADIADHCGEYTASVKIAEVTYGGVTLKDMAARMEAKPHVNPLYLAAINTAANGAGQPENGEGGQVMPLSDMFGYVIDLAFRTNAAESNLLLQVDAADRIYSTNTDINADTWGGGSSMTFTSVSTDFTEAQMIELMSAIRIVFFDPMADSGTDGVTVNKVLATAKLDMTKSELEIVGGNQITAKMYLYTITKGGEVSYKAVGTDVVTAVKNGTDTTVLHSKTDATYEALSGDPVEGTTYYVSDGGTGYTVATSDQVAAKTGLFVQKTPESYTEVAADSLNDDGTVTYYAKVTTAAGENRLTENVITALNQNEAHRVSVLVYLDGDLVGNEDVAASAAQSMTGTMNLQFASSANLVPMSYTPLKNQGDTPTESTPTTTAATEAAGG